MRILFVTSYPLEYNTSANVRNMGLIQGLYENGHQIDTFSPYPTDMNLFSGEEMSYPFGRRIWIGSTQGMSIDDKKKTILSRIKVWAYKFFVNYAVYDRRAMMTRLIKPGIVENKYDIIISSSDPKSAHLFAEYLTKTHPGCFARWIQYWGDPFTNDISNKHKFSHKRIEKEEKRLLSIADKVVYVSPFTREEIASKYPECNTKITFLPIPFYKKENTSEVQVDKNLLGYLGDYSSKNRNILPFIEAVKTINVHTVIAGSSDLEISSTEMLKVYGRLHGKAIDDIASKVGIYVCICNLHGTQIPGKVYHYVDTGKPILIILDGENEKELRYYFEGFKRFYLCRNNVGDIKNTIQHIMDEYHHFETPETLASKGIARRFVE